MPVLPSYRNQSIDLHCKYGLTLKNQSIDCSTLNGLTLKNQFSARNGDPSEYDNHVGIKMIHQKYLEIILQRVSILS